jgi:Cys-rich protein (TIGR01571 family)
MGYLRKERIACMRERARGNTKVFDPLPWSTGLCDLWSDPELLYTSSNCLGGVCCICYLPARTFVDILNDDPNIWDPATRLAGTAVRGAFGVQFSSAGQACLWNSFLLTLLPCIRIPWRWAVRKKYFVEGSVMGDMFASTLCCFCSAMQEAREVRVERDPIFAALAQVCLQPLIGRRSGHEPQHKFNSSSFLSTELPPSCRLRFARLLSTGGRCNAAQQHNHRRV